MAISYLLVAQLGAPGPVHPSSSRGIPAGIAARCRSEQPSAQPNKRLLAECIFQLLGAQHQRDLTLSHLLEYSLITLAAISALAAIAGWMVAGRAMRPVQLITAAARAASERNLSARVALRGPRDELRALAETFDDMLERLQAAFEAQQRFIANASHELRTPLTVMRATVDVVLEDPNSTPQDLRGMADDIRTQVDHAEQLISALLILARNERGLTVHEPIDLATVAEDVLDAADARHLQVHATLQPAAVSGDPVLVERLIANLIDNAVRYNTAGGEISVDTSSHAAGSRLTVANSGPPISTADAARILRPFERLNDRTTTDGFGLGLTIVTSIAAIHGGSVEVRPRETGGLTVIVTIPTPAGAMAPDTGGPSPLAAPR